MSNGLPIQDFVLADITIAQAAIKGQDFGLPIFVTDENTPGIDQGERIREYNSLTAVADDWNSTDEAYLMAQTAFGVSPQPGRILVGVRFTSNVAGFLQCASLAPGVDVDTFKAVTDGAFQVLVDGTINKNIIDIDFSLVTDLHNVASEITGALAGDAVCLYDPDKNRFVFNSLITGNTSSVNFLTAGSAGTDISGLGFLNGRQGGSARVVQGLTVGSLTDELLNIFNVSDEAYFLAIADADDISDSEKQEVAVWLESLSTTHQYFFHSNDPGIIDSAITTDVFSVLAGTSVDRTFRCYSGYIGEYPEVSILATAATVNFEGSNTVKILKYKLPAPGITAENNTGVGAPSFGSSQLNTLNTKIGNAYAVIAGKGRMATDGRMSVDVYQDDLHLKDWLKNKIETNISTILFNTDTKIPYTDSGLNLLEAGLRDALEQGVRNGGLAPIKDEDGVFHEAYTITRVPVINVDPVEKAARNYSGFSFEAILAGAIQTIIRITGKLTISFTG